MVASDLSPSPASATTVPNPNVSCDTRCPTSRTIAVDFLPVARGGGPDGSRDFFTADDEVNVLRPSFFHSINSEGISSKNREAGLYLGVPKVNRYSAREM